MQLIFRNVPFISISSFLSSPPPHQLTLSVFSVGQIVFIEAFTYLKKFFCGKYSAILEISLEIRKKKRFLTIQKRIRFESDRTLHCTFVLVARMFHEAHILNIHEKRSDTNYREKHLIKK